VMLWTLRKHGPFAWLGAAPVTAITIAVLLSSCAGYWYRDPSLVGFKQLPTQIVTQADLVAMCGSTKGCTRWNKHRFIVQSFVLADARDCDVSHEARHRAGWMHDTREVYREDCGE